MPFTNDNKDIAVCKDSTAEDTGETVPKQVPLPDDPCDDWVPLNKPNVNKEIEPGG